MKKCKQGYYYCYTDEVCKPIPKGLRVTSRFSGGGKEPEETGIDVPTNGNGNGDGNGNGGDGGGVSESKSGDSSLRDWFGKSRSSDGKPGWVQLGGKYAGKPCAKQPGQTTKPKCGSSKMAANLDDKEEKKAFNRKQRQDPNPDRKGKAINVKTEETVVEKAGEKDACYKKVKSRYSVWPSAYASGALVKCRKVGAANWGNKSESVEYSDWRNDFQAMEYEFVDIIKPEPIKGGQEQIDENVSSGRSRFAKSGRVQGKTVGDATNDEHAAKAKKAKELSKAKDKAIASKTDVSGMSPYDALIAKKQAEKKAEKVRLKSEKKAEAEKFKGKRFARIREEVEKEELKEKKAQKCWPGYEKKGTKKMFGKTYNNCVKKEGYDVGDVDQKVGAVTLIPKDEREAAKQRLLAKAKAKREKMKEEIEIDESHKNPESVKGIAKELDKAVEMHKSQAKRLRKSGVSEEKEESKVGGGNLKKLTAKAVRRVDADVDGDVDSVDMKSSETGSFVPSPDGKKKLKPKVKFEQSDWKSELEEGAAWTKKSGKSKSGGLNEKGRKSYERENPGSDLKAPSKKVGNPRRKSFCARMKGMRKRQKPSNNTGDDRLSKSLRAWNC